MATYESLEQGLDELGISLDRRLKRDAETIEKLVAACRRARHAIANDDFRGRAEIIAAIDEAIDRVDPCPF